MNKDYSKILIIFLIVNLIASLNVSNRLNALRKQEIHTSTYFEQTVEEELEMIQDKIEELREGLKWITDVEISLETNKKETQTIKFNWQIKDYNADSKVAFFYKFLNEDFVEIPVTYKTQGCFEAEIEIELLEQPIWTVKYETDYDYDEVEKDYECEYYVSVNEGDRIISSEIQKMDIGKLMAAYNAINVEVMFHDHKPQDISIAWDSEGQSVKRIYAQIYLEKRLLEEKELDKRKKNWIDWDVSNLNYDTLILCVEYEDDRVFKKEIWGKSVREQFNKEI